MTLSSIRSKTNRKLDTSHVTVPETEARDTGCTYSPCKSTLPWVLCWQSPIFLAATQASVTYSRQLREYIVRSSTFLRRRRTQFIPIVHGILIASAGWQWQFLVAIPSVEEATLVLRARASCPRARQIARFFRIFAAISVKANVTRMARESDLLMHCR